MSQIESVILPLGLAQLYQLRELSKTEYQGVLEDVTFPDDSLGDENIDAPGPSLTR